MRRAGLAGVIVYGLCDPREQLTVVAYVFCRTPNRYYFRRATFLLHICNATFARDRAIILSKVKVSKLFAQLFAPIGKLRKCKLLLFSQLSAPIKSGVTMAMTRNRYIFCHPHFPIVHERPNGKRDMGKPKAKHSADASFRHD